SRGTSAMPARAPCSNLRLCPPELQVSVLGINLAGPRTRAFLLLKAPSGETTNGADRKNFIMGSRGVGRPGGAAGACRSPVRLECAAALGFREGVGRASTTCRHRGRSGRRLAVAFGLAALAACHRTGHSGRVTGR